MRARTRWVLTMMVLAVALLVTVGDWGVYRSGEALAQVLFPSEDFTCYVINHGIAPEAIVTLADQFDVDGTTRDVVVREPQILCAPTSKEFASIDPAGPHLKCYNFTPASPPVNEFHTLCDQFHPCEVDPETGILTGGEQVKVQTAQYLCTLACKNPTTPFPGCLISD